MISARYVSDCLYSRTLYPVPGILVGSLVYLVVPGFFVGAAFYIFYANMNPFTIILSVINFILLSQIWIVMLYLGAIRNFRAITISWILGSLFTVFLAITFGKMWKGDGMMFGFNIGLVVLLNSLLANTIAEYPFKFRMPKEFSFYMKNYKGLFFSGFFLFSGMWIDKVVMWFSPERVTHLNNLTTCPVYDGGMFFSYLSIIPVLALFIFSLETNFYDSYIQYIQHIERNSPLSVIEEDRKVLFKKIAISGRSFLILQGCITIIVLALAPKIFVWFGIDFLELGIFRLGTLGAFFAALNFFIVIIFSYFDNQQNMLKITLIMFFSNAIFSIISLLMGFQYYGYGYCISMIFTFLIASLILNSFMNKLTYHVFISNVVKRQNITALYEKKK